MNTAKKTTTSNGLVMEFSPVIAEKILTPADAAANGVQTTRHRVQLRQEVKTTYPAARANDLYSSEELSGRAGQSFIEKRVAWLNVPEFTKDGDKSVKTVPAHIQAKLDGMDSPKLAKILSLSPILSADQERTIESGLNPKSYEDYVNDCVLDGDGNPVMFKGHKQYRKIVFSKSFVEDTDNRGTDYAEIVKSGKSFQLAGAAPAAVPATI